MKSAEPYGLHTFFTGVTFIYSKPVIKTIGWNKWIFLLNGSQHCSVLSCGRTPTHCSFECIGIDRLWPILLWYVLRQRDWLSGQCGQSYNLNDDVCTEGISHLISCRRYLHKQESNVISVSVKQLNRAKYLPSQSNIFLSARLGTYIHPSTKRSKASIPDHTSAKATHTKHLLWLSAETRNDWEVVAWEAVCCQLPRAQLFASQQSKLSILTSYGLRSQVMSIATQQPHHSSNHEMCCPKPSHPKLHTKLLLSSGHPHRLDHKFTAEKYS